MENVVETVLGGVSAEELGVVLPHEHVLVDFSKGFCPPPSPPPITVGGGDLTALPVTLENMGVIRRFPYSVRENLVLDEVDKAEQEVQLYKLSGGGTLCEMSVVGIRREKHSLEDLRRISLATGIHIVSATGFYCESFLPDWAREMSVRGMADFMTEELVNGVRGIKCGVMYMGCGSYPLKDLDRKALEAAAITHKQTGVAMAINPAKDPRSPTEILDVLCSHGVPPHAVSISHMDRTFDNLSIDKMSALCKRGCYINHSLFGKECSHYQIMLHFDFPSDAQRIQRVKGLINAGHLDRVLISLDVVYRAEWVCYGGSGYAHMLEHVRPKFLDRGVEQTAMDTVQKMNPRKWLTCSS